MTDEGFVEAIGKGCKLLTSLDLMVTAVADGGLAAIAEVCKSLELTSLDLRQCEVVTEEGAARLRAALPACEVRGH